jgi:hypothetical protein
MNGIEMVKRWNERSNHQWDSRMAAVELEKYPERL